MLLCGLLSAKPKVIKPLLSLVIITCSEHHNADEAPEDEVVRGWGKQHGEGIVPKREPGTDRNNREIYERTDLYGTDGGSNKKPEGSKSTKERWKREYICGFDIGTYAFVGCHKKCVKQGIYQSVLLLGMKQPSGKAGAGCCKQTVGR